MKYTVSNSALNAFFSGCPARLGFFRKYSMKPKFMPRPLRFGISVHQAIEQDLEGEMAADVRMVAERLLNLLDKKGYKILEREVKHLAPLTDDIDVFGIIDALVLNPDGSCGIIDFKTGSYPWETIETADGELITLKARTWQGAIYTLPPYRMPAGWKEWPGRIDYLTAPTNGLAGIFPYYANDADLENLRRAATMMKEAEDREWLPKNVGYECGDCLWRPACWNLPNWERHYDNRRGKQEEENVSDIG